LTSALGTGVAYTGGAGVDTLTVGATTKAVNTGAGNDEVTMSAAVGVGGSVDAGEGTDTLSMTAANAEAVSANATFEAGISNFEKVKIGVVAKAVGAASAGAAATAATDTINMANLDDINYLISAGTEALAGGEAVTAAAGILAVTNMASGGTFELTGVINGASSIAVKDAATGAADVLNIKLNGAANLVNTAATTVSSVETINIEATDSSVDTTTLTNPAAASTILLAAADTTKLVVSGNHGVNFTGSTLTKVVDFDSTGVVSVGNATGATAAQIGTTGAVTFSTVVTDQNVSIKTGNGADVISAASITDASKVATITTGAGNDNITGGAGADVIDAGEGNDIVDGGAGADNITGGAGNDALTGGAGADTISGDAGNDVITGGAGIDALNGGAGRDSFVIAANTESIVTAFDKIASFGTSTAALTAAEVTAFTGTAATFQAATVANGGADADVVDLLGAATIVAARAVTQMTGAELTLIAGATSSDVLITDDIKSTISAKGVVVLSGVDAAKIDTLVEWVQVANTMTATTGATVAFEFNGNTYLYQEGAASASTTTDDTMIELTGTDISATNGIVLIGSNVAATVGDIFIA
jgi:S-layer protein